MLFSRLTDFQISNSSGVCGNSSHKELMIQDLFIMKSYSLSMVVIFSVVNIMLAILSSCGNALVFLTVVSFSELLISSNIGLASLAAANFFEGVLIHCLCAQGSFLVLEDGCPLPTLELKIVQFLTNIFVYSAVLNLALVTLERYVGIIHSLRYHAILSRRRMVNFIFSIWFASLFISVPSLFDNAAINNISNSVMTVTLITALVVTFYFNLTIHHASLRQRRVVRAQEQMMRQFAAINQQRYRFRGAKTMLFIFVTLVLCFMPAVAARIIPPRSAESRMLRAWSGTIFGLHSSISPFVYFFRCTELRRYTHKLLRRGLRILKV